MAIELLPSASEPFRGSAGGNGSRSSLDLIPLAPQTSPRLSRMSSHVLPSICSHYKGASLIRKLPPPHSGVGPPQGPRNSPTVGS
eukprot:CAMPEP_0180132372 /NCGR_PEP_ID=MMETSP0986-20121125/8943_1 /TAXON_ID=697907 /ORGANISM="non described non described, Strain CCMP2293" /LENGTH=84 /DNA_ID=CAMNT_0022072361 /DNA_START=91 /DNA_END=345 /DNA_ORIENTATION=-